MVPSGRLVLSHVATALATALVLTPWRGDLGPSELLSQGDAQPVLNRARDAFTTLEIVRQADAAVAKLAKLTMVQPPRGVHAGWNSRPYEHPEPHHHIRYGCTTLTRGITLTFDDGPSQEYTPKLLDRLKELNIQATFFLVSQNAILYPDLVKRMIAENHTVGLHTASHKNLTEVWERKDWKTLYYEVDEAAQTIEGMTGQPIKYFRPPFGALNEGLREYLWERGITIIMWNAGCIDWFYQDAEQSASAVFGGMPDVGGIVCMHDTQKTILDEADLVVNWSVSDIRFPNTTRPIISLPECVGHTATELAEEAEVDKLEVGAGEAAK